jgi:hypothetical protein
MADVEACTEMLKSSIDDPCLRRVYARSIFAMVEGATDYMKRFTHDFAASLLTPIRVSLGILYAQCPIPMIRDSMDPDELGLLRDERREIRGDGTTRLRTTFLDFKTNIRFTIGSFCRAFQLEVPPDLYEEAGWSKLIEGERIRNRITHPKTVLSIDISEEELLTLRHGGQWIYDTYGRLLSDIGPSLERTQAELEAWLAQSKIAARNSFIELFTKRS